MAASLARNVLQDGALLQYAARLRWQASLRTPDGRASHGATYLRQPGVVSAPCKQKQSRGLARDVRGSRGSRVRRRVGAARARVTSTGRGLGLGPAPAAQVLLLDEVTVDMDVVGRLDLLAFFEEECAARGATILYATHIFDGLGPWLTHLAYIDDGRLTFGGARPWRARSLRLCRMLEGRLLPRPFHRHISVLGEAPLSCVQTSDQRVVKRKSGNGVCDCFVQG